VFIFGTLPFNFLISGLIHKKVKNTSREGHLWKSIGWVGQKESKVVARG
jgi:hypothetical protein